MHLIRGSWVAEQLREALGTESVCAYLDSLSVGPVTASLGDLASWLHERKAFWEATLEVEATPSDQFDLVRLLEAPDITIWAGVGTDDQLLAAWLCARLATSRIAPTIRLIQLESTQARARLPRDPERAAISPSHAERLRALWSAWTASEPTALAELSTTDKGILGAAATALLDRYPDPVHGLGRWDLALLRNIDEHGPKATRAIGHTLGESFDSLDQIGDGWLLQRLRRLGAGETPLLQITATSREMRDTSATLTDCGRAVLAGAHAAYELREIDDWIGGVHLSTAQNRIWLRTEDGLTRWGG